MVYYFQYIQINLDEGRIEKYILRKAFDDEEHPYLPKVLCNFTDLDPMLCGTILRAAEDPCS